LVFIFLNGKDYKENLSKVVNISSGFLILFIPYLLFNYINFGNIIPISGYLKSSFSDEGLMNKISEVLRYRETYFALVSIIFLTWFIYKIRELKQSENYVYYLFLAIFSFSNFLLLMYLIFLSELGNILLVLYSILIIFFIIHLSSYKLYYKL
jgi:hypothetical protein